MMYMYFKIAADGFVKSEMIH